MSERLGQVALPRLASGVSWFDDGDDLVVRSTRGAFRLPAERRDSAIGLLARLDGSHDLDSLLRCGAAVDGLFGLSLLSALDSLSVLEEGPPARLGLPAARRNGTRRGPMTVTGGGLLAAELRRHCDRDGGDIVVVALDGPDLSALERQNEAALRAAQPWIPVFPFGDAVVVGPLVRPGMTACFRCFELRWLGISPTIELERRHIERLRDGEWQPGSVATPELAACLADRLFPLLERQVHRPPGTSLVTLVPIDREEHHDSPLTAHPACEVCSGRVGPRRTVLEAGAAAWDEPARPLRQVDRSIRPLVDRFCGLATIVLDAEPGSDPGSACPSIALARFAVPDPDDVEGSQTNHTHGAGPTPSEARTLALVEAIERYCGLAHPRPDVITAYEQLTDPALLPTDLPLFSTAQYDRPAFPFRPFTPEQVLGWTWGYNVTRGSAVLVPSTAAWYGADDMLLGETSSGVSAHSSRSHALHNGALEIIERDAFMIHWLHRLAPPLFDRTALSGDVAAMVDHVGRQGYTVHLADLTTDLEIPVVLALGTRTDHRAPALLVGAGASLDPATALLRAVRELYAAASAEPPPGWHPGEPMRPEDVTGLDDHSRAYAHPAWLHHAAFLWAREETLPPPSRAPVRARRDSLRRLVKRLEGRGHDIIGVDITTDEVARRGLRVVRAIVPGLQPLGFGERVRLGGSRLYEAPPRMDPTRAPVTEDELNPVPHCFP